MDLGMTPITVEGVDMDICPIYGGKAYDGTNGPLPEEVSFFTMGCILTFTGWKLGNSIIKEKLILAT